MFPLVGTARVEAYRLLRWLVPNEHTPSPVPRCRNCGDHHEDQENVWVEDQERMGGKAEEEQGRRLRAAEAERRRRVRELAQYNLHQDQAFYALVPSPFVRVDEPVSPRRPARLIEQPIAAEGRLNLAVRRAELEHAQAKLLLELARETDDVPLRAGKQLSRIGDEAMLRGIPAVGPGCSGAIRGTRPGDGL